jgi:hypothetical protein
MSKLFRKKWFKYSWPFILLLFGHLIFICLPLLALSSPVLDARVLRWYPAQVIMLADFSANGWLYGLTCVTSFIFSMLWWFWRPGWPSCIAGLFAVCFVGHIPGAFIYIGFWGGETGMRLSARLHDYIIDHAVNYVLRLFGLL